MQVQPWNGVLASIQGRYYPRYLETLHLTDSDIQNITTSGFSATARQKGILFNYTSIKKNQ